MVRVQTQYTYTEELCNALTHMFGIAFSIAASSILITLASVYANVWAVVSCSIFGASMMLLYTASSVYHAIPHAKERAKSVLKKFDHIAIYYLIAGSYTPFLLVSLRAETAATAWTIFGIVWGLAIVGTLLKIFTSGSGTKLWSIGLYLAMGWMVVLVSGKLFSVLPASGIVFLVLGGAFYTAGVFFYVKKNWAFSHAIWHVFVLLGTAMHFFAVLFSCVF